MEVKTLTSLVSLALTVVGYEHMGGCVFVFLSYTSFFSMPIKLVFGIGDITKYYFKNLNM